MKQEKSCGAIVYRKLQNKTEVLILKHRFGGHWSFPKGHVEQGETERQTALREVKEETGLKIEMMDGFKQSVEYSPKPNVRKQVVYFLGVADDASKVVKQEEEVGDIKWIDLDAAEEMLTYENDKNLIRCAKKYLMEL